MWVIALNIPTSTKMNARWGRWREWKGYLRERREGVSRCEGMLPQRKEPPSPEWDVMKQSLSWPRGRDFRAWRMMRRALKASIRKTDYLQRNESLSQIFVEAASGCRGWQSQRWSVETAKKMFKVKISTRQTLRGNILKGKEQENQSLTGKRNSLVAGD